MRKLPKFFLTVSLTAFAVGAVVCFTNINVHPSWMVALPAGAIFFGMFLNAYMLQEEAARFDEEAAQNLQMALMSNARSETKPEGKQDPKRLILKLAMTPTK